MPSDLKQRLIGYRYTMIVLALHSTCFAGHEDRRHAMIGIIILNK